MGLINLFLKFAKYIFIAISIYLFYFTIRELGRVLVKNPYETTYEHLFSIGIVLYFIFLVCFYLYRKIVLDDDITQSLIWVTLANVIMLICFYLGVHNYLLITDRLPFRVPVNMLGELPLDVENYNWRTRTTTITKRNPQNIAFSLYTVFSILILSVGYLIYDLYHYKDLLTLRNIIHNEIESK